jgi:hypothetical protein
MIPPHTFVKECWIALKNKHGIHLQPPPPPPPLLLLLLRFCRLPVNFFRLFQIRRIAFYGTGISSKSETQQRPFYSIS